MPYANTGGGTRQSLTPAQAAAKKRKDAARLIQKAVPHMLNQAKGKPKKGESARMKAKRKSFKARHAKNIAKGKMSAAFWSNKEKW